MRRLLTIPISHYCEKARWGLERAGLVYREEPHLQILHRYPVRKAGGGRTVPVLVTKEGVYRESHDILEYASAKMPRDWSLYPDAMRDEAVELERSLDADYGVETRRLFYSELVNAPRDFIVEVNNQTAPNWEGWVMKRALPLAMGLLLRYLDVRPETVARARERIRRTLDDVGGRLADGRPFLLGDSFTGADITFAALSAPLVAPSEYGVRLPPRAAFPKPVQALLSGYDGHPAIEHARRLYATERRRMVPLDGLR